MTDSILGDEGGWTFNEFRGMTSSPGMIKVGLMFSVTRSVCCCASYSVIVVVELSSVTRPSSQSIFFVIFAGHEKPGLQKQV